MKLKNNKSHFKIDTELEAYTMRKIFKGCDATFTIHMHHKVIIHVTGVKSYLRLKTFLGFLEETYEVKIEETIIDSQFISH